MIKEYDIYYATGGGPIVQGGSDVWVNHWIDNIAPKLDVKPVLLIHKGEPDDGLAPDFSSNSKEQPKHFAMTEGYTEKVKEFNNKIEIVYYDPRIPNKFHELMGDARRINVLDGHYQTVDCIESNKDKIHSVVVQVSNELVVGAIDKLDISKSVEFEIELEWESKLLEWTKYPIWIGVDRVPLHDKFDFINIPNFYEFRENKEIVINDKVGFSARMETRKCPHYLEGIESVAFTSTSGIEWWEENVGAVFDKTKVYKFKYDNLDRFYNLDWGISHSCFVDEPFGYSIFQAVDYGKLPILHTDWCSEYEYPFRASNREEFNECYNEIKTTKNRDNFLVDLRNYLKERFDRKEEWTEKYLEVFNA